MAQQTAVEFLIEQIMRLAFNPDHHLGIGDVRVTQGMLDDWGRKAKQMEKEQIINAVNYGCDDYGSQKDGEEYYNQNYGTE